MTSDPKAGIVSGTEAEGTRSGRAQAVRRQPGGPDTPSRKRREADREKWKKDVGYGKGRTVEIVFSASRRMFGDHLYSKKWGNMVREVRIRAAAYGRWVGEALAAA